MWTREIQDVIFAILMCGWLGGLRMKDKPAEAGKLFTIEEVGETLNGKSKTSSVYTREHGKIDNSASFHLKSTSLSARPGLLYFMLSDR
jgi:hypothetical protein